MQGKAYKEITPQEAQEMVASGAQLIDVRELDEWNEGHIKEATLISLGSLQGRVGEISQEKPVVVVCRSGGRSGMACDNLSKQGYKELHNLKGGMLAWEAAKLPVTR